MKLATLCSGIGAPEVAAKRLGWECLWSAEVDPQASAVLAFHHPESVNLGDITKIDGSELEKPDVLVFGTPCQSFSVAGRRAGMDDPRGVLAFVALGIVGRVRPTWFILENVPGLLSSSKGRDFGAFLRAVDECGYSGAWASPDAQFFGLAQRRERVFFVGHSGDWRYPASVLSQFSRLCGHPAPSREAGEVASTLFASGAGTSRPAGCASEPGFLVMAHGQGNAEIGVGIGTTLNCNHEAPICFGWNKSPSQTMRVGVIAEGLQASPTSNPAVAFASSLQESQSGLRTGGVSGSLRPSPGGRALAFQESQTGVREYPEAGALRANGPGHDPVGTRIRQGMSVRRLTPRECERLQGFEDDYTLIPYKGKPMVDGPRYKMIGNSMAVKVLIWLLARIKATA